MIEGDESSDADFYRSEFEKQHQREFGFNFESRPVLIDNIRMRSVGSIGNMSS